MSVGARRDELLRRVGDSMFWNATLIPVITVLNLATSVIVRRTYGLDAGVYDILIGLTATVLAYSGLGIPSTFTKLIPDLQRTVGRAAAAAFVRRASLVRMTLLVAMLLAVDLAGSGFADRLALGEDASFYFRTIVLLALGRAVIDLANRVLQACMLHRAANLLLVGQAAALLAIIVVAVRAGGSIGTVALAAGVVSVAVSCLSALSAAHALANGRGEQARTSPAAEIPQALEPRRLWRFALFLYAVEMSAYFASPGFASPVLGVVADGVATAAIFNTGYQIPQMLSVLLLSSLQGLYRPLFARLLDDLDRLRTSYLEVAKVQAAILIPAGTGLLVMLGDYVPLVYSEAFRPAVPVARILTVALFVEAFLRLGSILLSTAEMARPVLAAQSLVLLGAFAFVLAAQTGDLVLVALIFPAGRLFAALAGHLAARRRFGVSLPWPFVLRAMLPSLAMAAVLVPARQWWSTGWVEAVVLTLIGMVVVLVGMRAFRVLGPREIDLLRRARVPGHGLLLGWLDTTR